MTLTFHGLAKFKSHKRVGYEEFSKVMHLRPSSAHTVIIVASIGRACSKERCLTQGGLRIHESRDGSITNKRGGWRCILFSSQELT